MPPTPEQLKFRALVQRIETDPNDAAAWLEYAHALIAKNDVRGELIKRQQENRDFASFVDANAAAIFGDAAAEVSTSQDPNRPFTIAWSNGSANRLTARVPSERAGDLLLKLKALLDRPIVQFLRGLHIRFEGPGSAVEIPTIVKPSYAHNLRELEIVSSRGAERSPAELTVDWLGISISLAKLETLRLSGRLQRRYHEGSPCQIDNWHHETVTCVELTNDNFLPDDFATLGGWKMPALERLELSLLSKMSYAEKPDLTKMFAAPDLPALRSLEIRGCRFTELLLKCLAGSPMLAQLEELDLRLSALGPEDISFLEQHESFRRAGLKIHTV